MKRLVGYCVLFLSFCNALAETNTFVAAGSAWKYLDTGVDPGNGWTAIGFDDSAWLAGPAQLGYGDLDEVTLVGYGPDPNAKYITTWFRQTFQVANPAAYTVLSLRVLRDDGVVVYLNGVEVMRNNMPSGPITATTLAPTAIGGAEETTIFISSTVSPSALVAGNNVLAVEVHQQSPTSSDMSFDLELLGSTDPIVNQPPIVSLTSPAANAVFSEPANIGLTASASDPDGSVARVEFFNGGTRLGETLNAPYTYAWGSVPIGSYALRAVAVDNLGARATSSVVNVTVGASTAPTITRVQPAAGAVSDLTQIAVTFSEPVAGVQAADLLINGTPAQTVTGGGAVYAFAFPVPREGVVRVAWDGRHGITDFENPPQPFNQFGAGAAWQYTLTDTVRPAIARLEPAADSTVRSLDRVEVTFSEPVWGVNAGDLLVKGVPAARVSGSGSGPYRFEFAQPANGAVQFSWTNNHGIRDFSTAGNLFAGAGWSVTLNTNAVFEGRVVINEIMYHPPTENNAHEFIELHNLGATAVNLAGWRFTRGVDYTFPAVSLQGGGYLVVAADPVAFDAQYPGVPNVIGGWVGRLSNTEEDIELEDASGNRVDLVHYADEGDFATRRRWPLDTRGWEWYAEHDGLGKSLELVNPVLPNSVGVNWAASVPANGTPGARNSTWTANAAPLISEVAHFPPVPRSTNTVTITAQIRDELTNGLTVTLWSRSAQTANPSNFSSQPMFDDGLHNDGAPRDGVYGAVLPAMNNGTIIEYYVQAVDPANNQRTWPAAALEADNTPAQTANALFQVDDSTYTGNQPVYRVILTESERALFAGLPRSSDAQMNATFVSSEGANNKIRYNSGIRYRGAGSRGRNPPTYRLNVPSDRKWNDVSALNLNSQYTHVQVIGAAIAAQAGLPHEKARAVQLRINSENPASSGAPQFGSYAHVEPLNGEWAEHQLPDDSDGNVYRASTGNHSATLAHLGTSPTSYLNAGYYKTSNTSENDWTDLINLTFALDPATTPDADYMAAVKRNVNIEQWLRYFATLSLMEYTETSISSGRGDDYGMYRGVLDPRFILLPHDFDTILGQGDSGFNVNESIFQATALPTINRFLHHPEIEPLYYAEFRRLLATTFSTTQMFPLLDQILGDWVPGNVISAMKTFVQNRNAGVLAQLPAEPATAPRAIITGEPPSATFMNTATLRVGGTDITHYRYKVNNGAFGPEAPVSTPITLSGLADGTYTVYVIGRNASGTYQSTASPSISKTWAVNTSLAGVVINEALARNEGAVAHQGTFPDVVELYNPKNIAVDLSGLRLTDTPDDPNKFTFPAGTTLGPGAYLVLYANNSDGTPGWHLGFSLEQNGESIYLYDKASAGGALLDTLTFGPQLPNLSVGRLPTGNWGLTVPTFGAANLVQPLGDVGHLRINEWLADGVFPYLDDFVELYNPDPLPVDLGGLYLTDNPIGLPGKHRIAPLSFIPAAGYRVFIADNNTGAGPEHLNFQLDLERGELGLSSADMALIDSVTYAQQRTGVSQGRSPNGGTRVVFFESPSPGAGNPVAPEPVTPQLIGLINYEHVWKYDETGTDLGTAWSESTYNDSAWLSGPGMLAAQRSGGTLPEPVRTALTVGSQKATFYFRTRFNITTLAGLSGVQLTHVLDDGAVLYLNGVEIYRYNMPSGAVANGTLAVQNILDATYQGPITLPFEAFRAGENVLAVEAHQASRSSADIVLGVKLDAFIVTNNPAAAGLVINEVLANNASVREPDGSQPDWIELYNPANAAVDLSDMSLSDDSINPRRWVFSAGAVIPARGYFRVRFDSGAPISSTNTGYGLNAAGDAVYLFNKLANGGAMLDSIRFGVQAPDFSVGRLPNAGTNWTLTLPTPLAANLVAVQADPMLLKVNEWLADPAAGEDWFEVYNPSAQPAALGGLGLTDDLLARNKYTIPALSFIGGGAQGFERFYADNNPAAGANHVNFRLSATGESLGIATAAGAPIHSVTFGAQTVGVTQGFLPDGSTNLTSFPATPTPGDSNYLPLPNVVINEVLTHSDAPLEDAIELRNTSAAAVNISGWYLSDSKNDLKRYRVPAGTTIPANGFRVFYENQFNPLPNDPGSFALSSANGDDLFLSAADASGNLTGYRAVVKFGPAANGVSFGRHVTSVGSDFVAMSSRTFGVDNPDTVAQFRAGAGLPNSYPRIGPVVISEIMYHPPDIGGITDNVAEEYIQLRNITASAVPLYDPNFPTNRWRLRDAVRFDFPPNFSLPPGSTLLVVSFDPLTQPAELQAFRGTYGLPTNVIILGPYEGKLDNNTDSIELYRPDPPQGPGTPDAGFVPYVLVERVAYADTAPWPAQADGQGAVLRRSDVNLFGNDPANWAASSPLASPGDSDQDGMPDEWEIQYGLLRNDPDDAALDKDGDGLSNLGEYLAGTSPTDPSSSLRLTAVPGANLLLRFQAMANKSYTVEYRNALGSGDWLPLAHIDPQPNSRTVQVTDSLAAQGRFYRLRSPRW